MFSPQLQQPFIQAQAVVDPGAFSVAEADREAFIVTVHGKLETGDPLPDRVYEIAAIGEPQAAFEGIERYVAEMQRVN